MKLRILGLLFLLCFVACGSNSETSYIFELIIRNQAQPETFSTPSGQPAVVAFSPALGTIHRGPNPIYQIGQLAAENGLENFAEDADPEALLEFLSNQPDVLISVLGVEPVEEDADGGLLLPGQSFRIVFNVEDTSARLTLLLQFLQSNDVFVGSDSAGIALFDEAGQPLTQNISTMMQLLDAGTEVNSAPGTGGDQALGQMENNTGPDESAPVRAVDDGFNYPDTMQALDIQINPISVLE